MTTIWRAWVGIVLIGIGLSITIEHRNYWMLLLVALGAMLYYLDRNKINEENESTIKVTTIVVIIMVLKDLFG